MPNLDGGHYFLTMLAPVRTDTMIDPIAGRSRSHRHLLAQKLALLPTGRQTASSPPDAKSSPFAANTLNHLARFVIIDGPAYNGRSSNDTLLNLIQGVNPLVPQPVDVLTTPFLLFAADIDAQGLDGDAALRRYTDTLWTTMQGDIALIFEHCTGFDAVRDAAGFHAFVVRCQIETTMPFNDYWANGLVAPAAPMGAVKVGAAIALAAAVYAIVVLGWPGVAIALGIVALGVFLLYRGVLAWGARPFPTAPDSDLPSVLKGLFLQQEFTRFASAAQGLDDAALHARFGAFLAAVRPAEQVPALAPGEVAAPRVEWTA